MTLWLMCETGGWKASVLHVTSSRHHHWSWLLVEQNYLGPQGATVSQCDHWWVLEGYKGWAGSFNVKMLAFHSGGYAAPCWFGVWTAGFFYVERNRKTVSYSFEVTNEVIAFRFFLRSHKVSLNTKITWKVLFRERAPPSSTLFHKDTY